MADNLSINITADTAGLRAQLAIAQADVRAYGAEVRKLATELRSAGDDAKAGLQGQLLQAAEHFERAGAAAAGFRGQLAPIKEHAHESESALEGLKERAIEVAAVFGVGFGLERIVEEFVQLAEKAEHLQNVASSIGVKPGEFAEISGAIQIATGNADAAARTFQLLERNIRLALETPSGTQGRAFEALKIGAAELNAALEKPGEFISVLADRRERFVTNSDTPAAGVGFFRDLLGRGGAELVPALARGAEHFEELRKEARELSGLTDETIQHLAETAEEINKIGLAWTGMKVAINENFRDPINEALGVVKELLKDTTSVIAAINKVKELRNTIGLAGSAAVVGGVVAGPAGAVIAGGVGAGTGFALDVARQNRETADAVAKAVPLADRVERIQARLEQINAIRSSAGFEAGLAPLTELPEDELAKIDASAPLPSPPPAATFGGGDRHDASLFNPTDKERAFLDEAKRRESGGRYGILHYPAEGQSGTVSSLADVEAARVTKNSHAFGAYGFQPGTYREMAAKTGLTDISASSQDINALELYRERGTTPWPWAAKGEGGGERAEAPNYKKIQQDYDLQIKEIDARQKTLMEYYDQEIKGAGDNQKKIAIIEAQKDESEKQAIAERQKRRDEALAKDKPGSFGFDEASAKIAGVGAADKDSGEQIRIATAAQERERRAEDQAARLEITKLETQRKVADQQEQTQLQRVEGERRTGDLTIDAAAQAEQQIVQGHDAKVAEILAQEQKQAEGIKTLATEVSNREIEQFTKTAEAKTRIDQKAADEHAQRAHSIDAELAGAASGLVVNAAWGKGGGIGQQIAGFVQSQEKKALDAVGTKLLDASGVGKLFEGVGDKLFSFLPGVGKTAGETVLGTASTTAAGQVAALGAAASAAAAQMSAGGAAGAIKGGGGLLGDLPIVGGLFGGGEAVAGIGGAATVSSGTSALDALAPALLAFEDGGVVPSAAGGMIAGGSGGQLSILHPQEMVLPAGISRGMQDMIAKGNGWSIPRAPAPAALSPDLAGGAVAGGGDTHTHNWNISGVLNTNDVQRLLMSHSETIAKASARASRDFSPHVPR